MLEDATLDHIVPLAKGGIDSVENLQICCKADNLFKGAIKPEEFNDRISQIFIYQTEKKIKNPVKRLMVHRMLMECAK